MKKKVAIICILVVLIVTGVGVILNKNISYNAFINKHFSQEFLVKSSRVQKEIRTEILENVFDIVNLEKQDVKNIQISDETEEQLLKKVWELEVYIEKVKIDDLSKADQERFLEFKKNSIENLKELYRLIDEYNEKTIQNKNITSHTIPFIMIRLSFLGRPCFPVFSGGNKGSMRSHSSSVNSYRLNIVNTPFSLFYHEKGK